MKLICISNSNSYLSEIADLYINCFSTGEGAQFLTKNEVEDYFKNSFDVGGQCWMFIEYDLLVALLLTTDVHFDSELPLDLHYLLSRKSRYIAELIVAESYRSKGLGQKLLTEVMSQFASHELLIRVWSENSPALNLYRKLGFTELSSLKQTKLKPDGETVFEMEKIYLHKKS